MAGIGGAQIAKKKKFLPPASQNEIQYLISSCLNFLENNNRFYFILGSQIHNPQAQFTVQSQFSNDQILKTEVQTRTHHQGGREHTSRQQGPEAKAD